MGGNPPLGYRPDGRTLAIVEEHADLIRDIFSRYRAIGNVRLLAQELVGESISVPIRTAITGRQFGGVAFSPQRSTDRIGLYLWCYLPC